MTSSKLISYTTREFLTENELELYVKMQDEIYTPAVIDEFIKSGLLRRVLTRVWNKKGASKLAIIFEYKDDQSFVACQKLLEKYHHPKSFLVKEILPYCNLQGHLDKQLRVP